MEKHFIIVACPRCRTVQVADGRNESRQCAKCGKRFQVSNLQVLGRGKDAREARVIASSIKAQLGAQETKGDIAPGK
ncbi:DUF1922 domain-containing protein [Candidatus Bathyarchaeota archaeon]|nr:MAG: DUF1922 domain-containing protein [Candidatus Bathyarchaeota archaeon]TMI33395.1 MAG: DUF1922 domain-containing protein [Candidatus Bathyarchaeota archaeon]